MKRWTAYLDGENGRVHLGSVYVNTEDQARARMDAYLEARPLHQELRARWHEAGSPVRLDPIT